MMVTSEESVGSVRRRADQHNKNIATTRERSNATAVKQDSKDDLAEEPPQAEQFLRNWKRR